MSWLKKFILAIFSFFKKPKPVTNLHVIIRSIYMKEASIQLNWTKSVTTKVVSQKLTLVVGTTPAQDLPLGPSVETYGPFDVPENTSVHVSLVANDGTFDSDPCVVDFTVGSLTPPAAPTNLTYTHVGTKDV